jgi:hypothetical protein
MDPDRLARLEAERRYLLGSLRDLDAEHAVGDVDDEDYATLRDGYVTRAAAVLDEIEKGRAALPGPPPRPWGRRVVTVVAVIALAVAAGWWVAADSGQRLPGQVATGGLPELYGRVLDLDPDNVEALTYRAWLSSLVAAETEAAVDPGQAREDLERAMEIDPRYPDAICFAGILAVRTGGGDEVARERLEGCLAARPPAEVRGLVENVLARLEPASEVDALLAEAAGASTTDPIAALGLYDDVLAIDPNSVPALVRRSWLLWLVSSNADPDVAVVAYRQSVGDVERALDVVPEDVDALCVAGILGAFPPGEGSEIDDPVMVRDRLERCQAAEPPVELASFLADALDAVDAAGGAR